MVEVYLSMFEECKRRFERALKRGDREEARKAAVECASLLLKLAEKNPKMAEKYIEMADEWSKTADRLSKEEPNGEGEEEAGNREDPYERYVEDLITKSTVEWNDIGGLEEVKRLLLKNVALAFAEKPEAIKPWRGILLFGPPGTGKTLLASAAAGSLRATFFNVKASSVLSKYYGESSKIISALYTVARERAPSIIFIDEIDALSPRRGEVHEATRRTLATLLAELDGFQSKDSKSFVLTLAATNTPWDLDEAMLSRFPLRVYVPLPDKRAARSILEVHLRGLDTRGLDLDAIAEESVRRLYSGREIASLCNLSVHNMIDEMNPDLETVTVKKISLKIRPLEMRDFEAAFKRIKSPLTRRDVERYERWAEQFGG